MDSHEKSTALQLALVFSAFMIVASLVLYLVQRETDKKASRLPATCSPRKPGFTLDENANQVKQGWDWQCWPNGLWKFSVYYKQGKSHGVQRLWYRSGRKWRTWNYHHGELCGVSCRYEDKDGAKCRPVKFKPCPKGD